MMEFLALPAEIRDRIYTAYFQAHRLRWPRYREAGHSKAIGILTVNKQIFGEIRHAMMNLPQFDVTDIMVYKLEIPRRSLIQMFSLRHVCLEIVRKSDEYHKMLEKLEHLESLVLLPSHLSDCWLSSRDSATGIAETDLDFIRRQPWRVIGSRKPETFETDPSRPIPVVLEIENIVMIWRNRSRAFKLRTEIRIFHKELRGAGMSGSKWVQLGVSDEHL